MRVRPRRQCVVRVNGFLVKAKIQKSGDDRNDRETSRPRGKFGDSHHSTPVGSLVHGLTAAQLPRYVEALTQKKVTRNPPRTYLRTFYREATLHVLSTPGRNEARAANAGAIVEAGEARPNRPTADSKPIRYVSVGQALGEQHEYWALQLADLVVLV